ncbi:MULTISPECIES: glycosyltransferase family 4 protein [unclassified Priestia]|uniref:glycosyltransferase family 4 protein n=1 Tax=unclassified Priestia TaxID=2800374 RepID=UPI00366C7BD3
MNVYINGRFLTQKTTGVQRVAEEILKNLDTYLGENDIKTKFIILTPGNVIKKLNLKNIEIQKINFLKGHLWEQVVLPFVTKRGFLINFCNTGPLFKKNQSVFIHDAAIQSAPEGFSKKFIYWYKIVYKLLGRNARNIITVSNFSKKELIDYYPEMEDKISVVYNGANHVLNIKCDNEILRKHNLVDKNFILAVSSANPNKNFKVIMDAISKMEGFRGEVIIAGGKQSNVFSHNTLEFNGKCKWVGYVSDEELVSLYKHAKVFVFPSIYEGFGLPPLEAMSLGCPVISSNKASMPEVLKDYAIYFDATNPEELIEKINLIFSKQTLVEGLRSEGEAYAQTFTWEKAANQLVGIVQREINIKEN